MVKETLEALEVSLSLLVCKCLEVDLVGAKTLCWKMHKYRHVSIYSNQQPSLHVPSPNFLCAISSTCHWLSKWTDGSVAVLLPSALLNFFKSTAVICHCLLIFGSGSPLTVHDKPKTVFGTRPCATHNQVLFLSWIWLIDALLECHVLTYIAVHFGLQFFLNI